MIYISNAIYLALQEVTESNRNKPFIGYNSVFAPGAIIGDSDFGVDALATITNLWSPDTYTHFRAAEIDGDYTIDFNNTDNTPIDYFAIVGHNMFDWGYSYSISYYNGSGYTTLVDNKTPINNHVIIEFFNEVSTATMRLTIHTNFVGAAPAESYLKIAHIKTGKCIFLQRRPYVGVKPLTMDSRYEGIDNTSDNGNYLGSYATSESQMWEIKQEHNTPDFVRQKVIPFINHLNGINSHLMSGPPMTFVYAWRPDDYPNETLYCWKPLRNVAVPENSMRNGMMAWDASGKGFR